MFHSNDHLRAEADYRREALSRRRPLYTPEHFRLEARERRLQAAGDMMDLVSTWVRSTLGRLAGFDLARVLGAGRRPEVGVSADTSRQSGMAESTIPGEACLLVRYRPVEPGSARPGST